MLSKSWPTSTAKQRRPRGFKSCPSSLSMKYRRPQKAQVKKKPQKPKTDPAPGPSNISQTPECSKTSAERMKLKRKSSSEEEEDNRKTKRSKEADKPQHKTSEERMKLKRKSSSEEEEDNRKTKKSRDANPPKHVKCKAKVKWTKKQTNDDSTDSSLTLGKKEAALQKTLEEELTVNTTLDQKPAHQNMLFKNVLLKNLLLKSLLLKNLVFKNLLTKNLWTKNLPTTKKNNLKMVAIKRIPKDKVQLAFMTVNGFGRLVPWEVYLLCRIGAGPNSFSSTVTPVLLDWFDLGNEVVLVLERPNNCMNLEEYMQKLAPKSMDYNAARDVFRQLVDAAILLESYRVFHRDIKPSNILIETGSEKLKARFIDFGCGTTYFDGETFSELEGTPEFFAPEYFKQHTYSPGPTTVWQLGLLLYIMLFKKNPVNEDTFTTMGARIPFTIPADCRNLLKSCLEKNPNKRPTLQDLRRSSWLNPTS
ncbi:hypothetical protein WMY93_003513 [Mugilogobius chulae]|uniref:Serine/threonine-protein kinase 1 n=1 Tax=Mugilogobius chulae TaxID=88201 RepID=A0AAW0Q037_9GOBI